MSLDARTEPNVFKNRGQIGIIKVLMILIKMEIATIKWK